MVAAARAMHGRVDGLIVLASEEGTTGAVDRISRSSPVVLLNPCRPIKECSAVSLANYAGARTALAHLLDLGHREIAIIKGPTGNVDAKERLRGYRRALTKAGITPLPSYEIQGDFTELSGHRCAEALSRLTPRPTAVFTANDCMAIGLLSGLHDRGITVPNDLAVVGFDDITMARYLSPPLTTVHVDTFALGQCAAQLLLSRLWSSDPTSCSQEILPATLVVRSSCGSARPREQLIESS
jgi:LacI family transcriptional regulator